MVQFTVRYHVRNVRCGSDSTGCLVLLWLFYNLVPGATLEVVPGCESVNKCVCPGDQLTYRCTVQGDTAGATIWNGTAFLGGCQQNEILLLHRQFTLGSTRVCNNGAIVGQSLGVQGNSYTSELNVTITPETAGKTITCAYDALTNDQTLNMIKFSTIVPSQPPTPSNLHISAANFVTKQLTLSWSPVAPDCPAIHYNILASNCGSCPNTTNHTNVTCTDVPTENSVCIFAIQTVLCGSLVGNKSDPVIVTTTTLQERNNADICTNTAYLATISSLVVALITSVVVLATAIVIILQRSKAKIKELQSSNRATSSTHMESMYADPSRSSSVSAINTKENAAYTHTKPATTINTKENVAYGHTKTATSAI